MFTCAACHAKEGREEYVDEVFRVGEQYVLVGSVPALVCARCGEQSFSRETAEKVRLMVHSDAKASRSIPMDVFDFAQ